MRRLSYLAVAGIFALGASSCHLVLGIEKANELSQNDADESLGGTDSGPKKEVDTEKLDEPNESDKDPKNSMGGTNAVDPASTCERYCDDMELFCSDESEQFTSRDQCMQACELYDEGEVGEGGPTQACRSKFAAKGRYTAGKEREISCRKAGPGGYEACGTICEGYCAAMMAACTPEVTSLYFYGTYQECLSECADVPAPEDVLYSTKNVDVFDGGHLQCRLFHALSALMLDAEEHCEHALGVTLCEFSAPE